MSRRKTKREDIEGWAKKVLSAVGSEIGKGGAYTRGGAGVVVTKQKHENGELR